MHSAQNCCFIPFQTEYCHRAVNIIKSKCTNSGRGGLPISSSNALTSIIGDIYEASYNPGHWPVVLEGISRVTGSASAAMLYQDNELEQAGGMFTYNIPPDTAVSYSQAGPDPNFQIIMENMPIGTAGAVDHLVPDRQELEAYYGDFYTDFLAPNDMHHIAGIILFNDAVRTVGIGLQRKEAMGVWAQSQIDMLTELAPHIQRALHIHKEFTRLRMKEQALQAGLDRLVMGMVLFDSALQPVYCNPVAESILNTHPAIRLQHNKLYAATTEDTEKIHKALLKALNAGAENDSMDASTALGLTHASTQSPLPILIAPVNRVAQDLQVRDLDAYVALCVSDPEKNQPVVPEALCSAYQLTPAEAQVAIAIANGLSVEDIAKRHNNTMNTVRSQIKTIFRKLGINRQGELVKILLSGPFRAVF